MKLNGDLKKKVENVQSKEEATAVLSAAVKDTEDIGLELSDEDMDQASGGTEGEWVPGGVFKPLDASQ